MQYLIKRLNVLAAVLTLAYALYPLCAVAADICGYTLRLFSHEVYSLAVFLITLLVLLIILKIKRGDIPVSVKILLVISVPFSGLSFLLNLRVSQFVALCMLVCFVCTVIMALKIAGVIAVAESVIVSFFVFIAAFAVVTFGNFSNETVVGTVSSPQGMYYAEIIDSDQGALGGNTLVKVYENRSVNALVFTLKKQPVCVYSGRWREYMNMQIYWKNDTCLIINSREYKIDF